MYVKLTNGQPEIYSIGQLRRDNPNTSFPKNIPDERLAEYNVYPVTVLDQPATTKWQKATRNDLPTLVDGVWTLGWTITTTALDDAKVALTQELAERRWQAEEGGTVFSEAYPVPIATDRITQAKITAAYVKASADPNYTIASWKGADGTFMPLDATTIIAMANIIETHVQACFSHEATLAAQISAAASLSELDAVDLENGWP